MPHRRNSDILLLESSFVNVSIRERETGREGRGERKEEVWASGFTRNADRTNMCLSILILR